MDGGEHCMVGTCYEVERTCIMCVVHIVGCTCVICIVNSGGYDKEVVENKRILHEKYLIIQCYEKFFKTYRILMCKISNSYDNKFDISWSCATS